MYSSYVFDVGQCFEITLNNIYSYSALIVKALLQPCILTDDRFTSGNLADFNISKISTLAKFQQCLYTSKFFTAHICSK